MYSNLDYISVIYLFPKTGIYFWDIAGIVVVDLRREIKDLHFSDAAKVIQSN